MHWQALGKNETVPNFVEGLTYEIQDVSHNFTGLTDEYQYSIYIP